MSSLLASLRRKKDVAEGEDGSPQLGPAPSVPLSLSSNVDNMAATLNQSSNSSQKVFVGGYLMKKGLGLAVWQRRFFLFKDNQLEYRKTPTSTEILGVIPLRRFDIVAPNPDSKDFEIHTPGRIYYLRGENLQSKVNWVNTLLAHQKRLVDFPTPFTSIQDPAAGSTGSTTPGSASGSDSATNGSNGTSGLSGNRRAAPPVPTQASIHCGVCKSAFSVARERHYCIACGYAYCNSSDCFNLQNKVCSICRVGGPAMGTLTGAMATLEAARSGASVSATLANSGNIVQAANRRVVTGGLTDASAANLMVRVVEARDLRGADRSTSRDPYAVLFVGDRRFQTKTCHRTLFPWWNEDFTFPLTGLSNRTGLQVAIFDEDKHTTDAFLGMVYLPIAMFRKDTHIDAWFTLQPRPSDSAATANSNPGSGTNSSSSASGDGDGDIDDLDALPTAHSSESAAAAAAAKSGSWLRRKDTTDVVSGAVHLQIVYSYSPTTLLEVDDSVKAEPPLSKKTLAANVRRVQRIVASLQISEWKETYKEIMLWRRPFRTLFTLVIYCFTVLYFPARLVPAVPFLIALFYICATYVDRRFNSHSFPLVYEPDDGSSWTDASIDALVAADGEDVDEDDLISTAFANALAPYAEDGPASSVAAFSASAQAAVIAKRRSLIPKLPSGTPTSSSSSHKPITPATADSSVDFTIREDSEYDYSHYEDQPRDEYDNDEEDEEYEGELITEADYVQIGDLDTDSTRGGRMRSSSTSSRITESESSVLRSRRVTTSAPPSVDQVSITSSPDSILHSLPQSKTGTSGSHSAVTKSSTITPSEPHSDGSTSDAERDPKTSSSNIKGESGVGLDVEGRSRPLPMRQRAYGLKGISAALQTVGSRSPAATEGTPTASQCTTGSKGKSIVQFARKLFGFRSTSDDTPTPAASSPATSTSTPAQGEKKLGLIAQARKYQRSVQTIQNRMGDVCDVIEQIDAVLSWQDYRRSVLVLKVMLAIALVLVIFPLRLVLLVAGLVQFTAFFRKRKGTKTKTLSLPERLVLSAPREADLELSEDALHPALRRK